MQTTVKAVESPSEAKNDEELYKWGVHTENPKVSICYVWKSHKDM